MELAHLDYKYCLRRLSGLVEFVTVNISSPNTRQLKEFQSIEKTTQLLKQLVSTRDSFRSSNGKTPAIFVKISPDLGKRKTAELCRSLKDSGCDGIVATNTTENRPELSSPLGSQSGGLSGKPLFPIALRIVENARKAVGPKFSNHWVRGSLGC